MDLDRLEVLIDDIRNHRKGLHAVDLREASPLASEILSSKPYTFIDDTPFEERRTLAVNQRRWIDPAEAKELGKLDQEAIKLVREEAWIQAQTEFELHDGLLLAGFLTDSEVKQGPDQWLNLLKILHDQRRVVDLAIGDIVWWVAIERIPEIQQLYPETSIPIQVSVPAKYLDVVKTPEKALIELIRSRLEVLGPVTEHRLSKDFQLESSRVELALLALEQEGFVFQGQYSEKEETEWCERRLLARIHRYTLRKLRREIAPVAAADFMRYLFEWQFVTPDSKLEGPQSLEGVLDQLEGFDAPAVSWEADIFPSRVKDYDYLWLDIHCLSGNFLWGRFANKAMTKNPVKTTPITFIRRTHLDLWKPLRAGIDPAILDKNHLKVWEYLKQQGATFFNQISSDLQMLKVEVEESLAALVSFGLVTSDSFNGLRALLVPSKFKISHSKRRKTPPFSIEEAGRWATIQQQQQQQPAHPAGGQELSQEELMELARVLLRRYGVVFRKLIDREKSMPPWRDLVRVFRLMEARGQIRGGRFVTGVWGEQFALKEALTKLRAVTKMAKTDQLISISAADPLNLTGIITPGGRVPAMINNRILYLDGEPVAVKNGKEVEFLKTPEKAEKWNWHNALIQREVSPKLKPYLGKGIG
jgi:ATP-dependent Lhr-like helicase